MSLSSTAMNFLPPFLSHKFQSKEELQKKLLAYSQQGKVKELKSLLEQKTVNPNEADPKHKGTPLYLACQRGHYEAVKVLLSHPEIDVNLGISQRPISFYLNDSLLPSPTYLSPLHIACARGHLAIVNLLLSHPSINPNLITNGLTPLHAAIRNGQYDVIKMLLAHPKIKGSMAVSRLLTPLHYACEVGSGEIVGLLLEQEEVRREAEREGAALVDWAEYNGNPHVALLLRASFLPLTP